MSLEYVKENWLTKAYDYELPRQGELREGILLELGERGAIIDIGMKHDGIVPREDLERLEEEVLSELEPGQRVTTQVIRPEDREGTLKLSLYQPQAEQDWLKAQKMLQNQEIWTGKVIDFNQGGLLVKFGHLQGFVPASHLWIWDRKQSAASSHRKARLKEYVDQELPLIMIEVNSEANRLICSERLARQQQRRQSRETLLAQLAEGQICRGVVRHLTDFGAFVDLGEADGLIHISELAHHHVQHPGQVVQVGDEIEVYVLNLDRKRKRINLSLKRLQPNPWDRVNKIYTPGQLVSGTVTQVVNFGVFVALDAGVEGLVHISELADPTPHDPRDFVERGQELTLLILGVDPGRQRLELSLKQATPEAGDEPLARSSHFGGET